MEKMNKVDQALKMEGREAFEEKVATLVEAETESPVVVALVDVDHMDPINLELGEEEGDRIIIAAATHIRKSIPKETAMYRVGGDEFGMIFSDGLEKEEVLLLLESVRAGLSLNAKDGRKMHVSFGMATAVDDAQKPMELIRKAESALFRAKANGGDRVAMAKEEKLVPKTSHYTSDQLKRLTKLSKKEGVGEAILLREALDMLLKKYDI